MARASLFAAHKIVAVKRWGKEPRFVARGRCAQSSTRFRARLVLSRIGAGFKGTFPYNTCVCSMLHWNHPELPEDVKRLESPPFPGETTTWSSAGVVALTVFPGRVIRTLSALPSLSCRNV